MQFEDTLFGTVKNGVLVLAGYVSNVTVEHGSLLIRDGIKGSVVERQFGRAYCPISRLISTQSEGYISFSAVRWLHAVGASIAHLNFDGTPLLVSGPGNAVPASLRRKQAVLSADALLGGSIVRHLLRSKLALQIRLLEQRGFHYRAAKAKRYAEKLPPAKADIAPDFSLADLLGIEGMVSVIYWKALKDTPLHFGRRQHVPEYWKTFGTRRYVLTGQARGAVTPGNAMLNYLYGVLASEITIALHALGLDPALGIMHSDKDNRASLTYDLIEPARPILDRWFFQWLQSATFSRRDFIEDMSGGVRIMRPLSSHLAMTAALWRGLADQLVRWIYKCLSAERVSGPKLAFIDVETEATRPAARWTLGNALQRPIPPTCAECGKALQKSGRDFCSRECRQLYNERPGCPGG
jgi:CRISPR-associated protein Cas1